MKKAQRYDTSHLIESQFEPGSNEQVLKNKNLRDNDLVGVEVAQRGYPRNPTPDVPSVRDKDQGCRVR